MSGRPSAPIGLHRSHAFLYRHLNTSSAIRMPQCRGWGSRSGQIGVPVHKRRRCALQLFTTSVANY